MYDTFMELNSELKLREEFLRSIGETEETLLEMAQVGVVDGTIYIKIYSGEGAVPHFHFYENQSGRKGCLKILEASYFVHGNYLDGLKRDERKELMDWLQQINSNYAKRGWQATNWQVICLLWDQNNPSAKLKDPNPPIPDYMKI